MSRRMQLSLTGTEEEMREERNGHAQRALLAGYSRIDPKTGKRTGSISTRFRQHLQGRFVIIDGEPYDLVPVKKVPDGTESYTLVESE